MDYYVIEDENKSRFEALVKFHLESGWKLAGGHVRTETYYPKAQKIVVVYSQAVFFEG